MHEYSIVSSLINQVEGQLKARGASTATQIEVTIGELAGVNVELLRTAYDTFREGSGCAGARLLVRATPASWGCPRCGNVIGRGAFLRCAICDVPAQMNSGDEIILERIEMEVP